MRVQAKLRLEDVSHHAVAIDDERRPAREQAQLRADAVERSDFAVLVTQQNHRQVVFAREPSMRHDAVGADTYHLRSRPNEFVVPVAECARFHRATRSVVLRIEKEDDWAVCKQRGKADARAGRRRERKIRSVRADGECQGIPFASLDAALSGHVSIEYPTITLATTPALAGVSPSPTPTLSSKSAIERTSTVS